MARLTIGVDVVGVQQVNELSAAVGRATTSIGQFYAAQITGSQATANKHLSATVQAFKSIEVEARKTSAAMAMLFNNVNFDKTFSSASKSLGVVEGLTKATDSYGAALKRLSAIQNSDIQSLNARTTRINAATEAIKNNKAAYETLRGTGVSVGKFDKNIDYSYQLSEGVKLNELNSKLLARETALASMRKAASEASQKAADKEVEARKRVARSVEEQFFAQQRISQRPSVTFEGLLASNKARAAAQASQVVAESKGLFSSVAQGVPVLHGLSKAWDAATKSSGVFHHTLRGVAGASGSLWLSYGRGAEQIGAMAAAFAAVSATFKTISAGSDFDYATRSFQNLAKGSEQGVAGLRNIQQAVLEFKGVAAGPNELAAGLLEFARAGKTAEESLAGIAETSRFAYLGEMELAKAVELVVGQTAAFKGLTVDQALNTMAAVADKTSISLQQMTEAFKNTTSIGTVLGVRFDDVAIALGVMGEAGIRGATAGAALNTMMYKLVAPTEKTKKTMDALGVSFSMIDDKTRGLKTIEQAINDLATATKGLSTVQKGELFESMVGLRGLKALGALVAKASEGSEAFEDMKKSVKSLFETMGDGAPTYLQERFDTMAKSGKVALDLLKADFEKLFVSSYNNDDTVAAIDNLRAVLTDPAVKEGVASIVSGVITIGSALTSFASTFGGVLAIGFFGKILFGKVAEFRAVAAGAAASIGLVGEAATVAAATSAAAAKTVTLAWGAAITGIGAALYALHTEAEVYTRKAIEAAQKNKESLAQAANLFASGDTGPLYDGLLSAEQERAIELEVQRNQELAKRGKIELELAGLKKDISDQEIERLETVRARMDSIQSQVSDLNKTPIQVLDREQSEAIRQFELDMAATRTAYADNEEGQRRFNAELEKGKTLINNMYDGKMLLALSQELTGALQLWNNYFLAVASGNAQAMQAGTTGAAERSMRALAAQTWGSSLKGTDSVRLQKMQASIGSSAALAKERDINKALLMSYEEQEVAYKSLNKTKNDSYKGTVFSAQAVAKASDEERMAVEEIVQATVPYVEQGYALMMQQAQEVESQKALTVARRAGVDAARGQKDALRDLTAEIKLSVETQKDNIRENQKWIDSAEKSQEKIESLYDKYASINMSTAEKERFDQAKMWREVSDEVFRYNSLLETSDQHLTNLENQYRAVKGALDEYKSKLTENPSAGSDAGEDKRLIDLKNSMDEYKRQIGETVGAIEKLKSKQQEANIVLQEAQETYRDKSPWEAMIKGMQEVEYTNLQMTQDIANATQNAFSGMTDALVDFVMTGKFEIKDLADSIIRDFARVAIQQSITGPLATGLGNMLGGGGGGNWLTGWLKHDGGVIGADSSSVGRSLPSWVWENAPRFHSGLMPDEFPAILQKGEGVFTAGQMAALSGMGGTNVVINVIESPIKAGQQEQRQQSNGVNVIDIFVDRIKASIASDIVTGGGVVPTALVSAYGLGRQTR